MELRTALPHLIAFLLLNLSASGGIIQLSTTCTDGSTISTEVSASCTGTYGTALAQINGYLVSTDATYTNDAHVYTSGYARANAVLDTDLTVLATGGVGTAYYYPCLSAYGMDSAPYFTGWAAASFGSINVSAGGGIYGDTTCPGFGPSVPITFGVEQTFHVHLESHAGASYDMYGGGGHSSAAFSSGYVADRDGNPIDGANVSVGEAMPEPAAFLLMAAGLALLAIVKRSASSRSESSASDYWTAGLR